MADDAPPAGTTPPAGTPPAGTAPPAGSPPPAAWHTGVDAEFIGHAQNRGWNMDDPKEAFVAAAKQARELEKHFGVPPDQLLKMPKANAPEADIKAFYQRLGAPADPKDYDFSALKFNGEPLDPAFQDAMRASLAAAFVPKDKAVTVAAGVVKFLEDSKKAEAAAAATNRATALADLRKDWGNNFDFNLLKAQEGARRWGISPEAVTLLEGKVGYVDLMNKMRQIGVNTSEATFVERGLQSNGNPTTQAGAVARLAELKADPAWTARLLAGDAATRREWNNLEAQIAGESPIF